MKRKLVLSPLFLFLIFNGSLFAQIEDVGVTPCSGYPSSETCCQEVNGLWMPGDTSNFCYLDLWSSRVTKLDCMTAGGYAHWRNDTTMLCLPKGVLLMSGEVTAIDESLKTIALLSDGQSYSIHGDDMILPLQGSRIDLFYIIDPDGVMRGKTCIIVKEQ